jgi:hypothetical protein
MDIFYEINEILHTFSVVRKIVSKEIFKN